MVVQTRTTIPAALLALCGMTVAAAAAAAAATTTAVPAAAAAVPINGTVMVVPAAAAVAAAANDPPGGASSRTRARKDSGSRTLLDIESGSDSPLLSLEELAPTPVPMGESEGGDGGRGGTGAAPFPTVNESTIMFMHVFKCAGSTLRCVATVSKCRIIVPVRRWDAVVAVSKRFVVTVRP